MKKGNYSKHIFFLSIIFFGLFGLAPYQSATGQAQSSEAVYPVAGRKKFVFSAFLSVAFVILVSFLFTSPAYGAEYYVATNGSDSNNGSISSPWATFDHAMGVLQAGDTLIAKAGTYNQKINVIKSGTAGNPITIQGTLDENGNRLSIIDPYVDATGGWVAAPEIGSGVYKKTIGYDVFGLYIVAGGVPYKVARICQPWQSASHCSGWQSTLAKSSSATYTTTYQDGINPLWWDGIEVIFTSTQAGVSYIRFRNGDNPNNYTIRVMQSEPDAYRKGSVVVFGVNYITIKNFEIRAKEYGVYVTNWDAYAKPTNIIIDNNKIVVGQKKMQLNGDTLIASNNEITSQSYAYYIGGYTGGAWLCTYSPSACTYRSAVNEHIYMFIKYDCGRSDGGLEDGAITFPTGRSGFQAYNNKIYNIDEGIAGNGNNYEFYNNEIYNSSSLCFYFDGKGSQNSSVHDNLVYNCNTNFRFGTWNGGNTSPSANYATINLYKNRSWMPHGIGEHIYYHFYVDSGTQTHNGKVWWYHNSFSGGRDFEYVSEYNSNWGGNGMTETYYVNNIMSTNQFEHGGKLASNKVGLCSYNWISGTDYASWCDSTNINNGTTPMWDTTKPHDFTLPSGSSAINAGIDVAHSFMVGETTYLALPGMVPGYFSGPAPDMGAYQHASGGDTTPPASPTGLTVL